ncbi:hypothetical protein [Cohnella candidum]|uniref:Lipoprotein n=1 Tax=Cohnella candidum TaxID=2674991 RepID=A0A3G3JW41_9BACL|nr:hypothetical protein [Cohnella candidum]AYQ72448.1 hypothetical protein EAV92_07620 [Cohnella candidum]
MKNTYKIAVVCLLTGALIGGCSSNKAASTATDTAPDQASASAPASTQPAAAPSQSASAAPSATASAAPAESALPGEEPITPEKNPPGDIPDSQAFVKYHSKSGGYTLDVPEGWGRTEQDSNVSFIDKLDGVKVEVKALDQAPTIDSVKSSLAADLAKNGRAVKIVKIKEVSLPHGKAIKVSYESNSEPNEVTGKQVRQENETYYYWHNKVLAALTMWAPLGADNVDQWKRMSDSFGWDAQ